ncbi:MAG: hypothetical protein K2M04_04515, partial [Muribaculaceae bacterium]|nr:hypothetical protein [Muribaculaceae bacterium]
MPRLTTITPNDLLGNPSSRRLVLRLSPARLTVWIGDPTRHSSSVFTTIPLSPWVVYTTPGPRGEGW